MNYAGFWFGQNIRKTKNKVNKNTYIIKIYIYIILQILWYYKFYTCYIQVHWIPVCSRVMENFLHSQLESVSQLGLFRDIELYKMLPYTRHSEIAPFYSNEVLLIITLFSCGGLRALMILKVKPVDSIMLGQRKGKSLTKNNPKNRRPDEACLLLDPHLQL